MNRLSLLLVTIIGLMVACNSPTKTERIIIASERGDCTSLGPQKCLLVKEGGQTDWAFFYNNIEGFTYEPGYEYIIEIEKREVSNPAADASSIQYIFVKEISKTAKTSEGLPQIQDDDDFLPDESDLMYPDSIEVDG